MGMPSKGTIVTINFPFSDLSSTKKNGGGVFKNQDLTPSFPFFQESKPAHNTLGFGSETQTHSLHNTQDGFQRWVSSKFS